MKIFELVKKIIGAGSFCALVFFKITGGDIDVYWILIPALLMGLSTESLAGMVKTIKGK